jgi:hypothetical protein
MMPEREDEAVSKYWRLLKGARVLLRATAREIRQVGVSWEC